MGSNQIQPHKNQNEFKHYDRPKEKVLVKIGTELKFSSEDYKQINTTT
jgi:hypothetical protein